MTEDHIRAQKLLTSSAVAILSWGPTAEPMVYTGRSLFTSFPKPPVRAVAVSFDKVQATKWLLWQ